MRSLRRFLLLKALLALLALLLGGARVPAPVPVAPAGPAVYVPGPQNKTVPKPSCVATVKPGTTSGGFEWFAWCATTRGDVTRCCFRTGREAEAVANEIRRRELRRQGGVLLR